MERINKAQVENWIELEEDEFYIDTFRKKHNLSAEDYNFYETFKRLCKEKKLKKLGRGLYRKIKKIKPIRWQDADESVYFNLTFPKSHEDESSFCFGDLICVSPGDLIILAGVSNYGKSAIALNILGENIDSYDCILMGNEYTTLDGIPSPKFKRRMLRMKWVEWFKEGNSKFKLLPVRDNFEDYVEDGKINIIDWINLTEEVYRIGGILENIKSQIGSGIAIVVLQKNEDKELARGGGYTRDLADVYLKINPYGKYESMITIDKVKEAKVKVFGRTWAFSIIDGGANLNNIREVFKCGHCYGKGYTKYGKCEFCEGKGYVDKDIPL